MRNLMSRRTIIKLTKKKRKKCERCLSFKFLIQQELLGDQSYVPAMTVLLRGSVY